MAEKKLQAGLFSDEIYLEKSTKSTPNDFGESLNSWASVRSVWVMTDFLSGNTEVKNDVEQRISKLKVTGNYIDLQEILKAANLYRLKIYDLGTISPDFTYYYITEVKPIGFRNREFIELYCKGRY